MQSLAKKKLGKLWTSFPKHALICTCHFYSYESVCDVGCNPKRHQLGLSNPVTWNMLQQCATAQASRTEKRKKRKGVTVYGKPLLLSKHVESRHSEGFVLSFHSYGRTWKVGAHNGGSSLLDSLPRRSAHAANRNQDPSLNSDPHSFSKAPSSKRLTPSSVSSTD